MTTNLYSALIRHEGGNTPVGKAASLLRETEGTTEIIVASANIVSVAKAVGSAPFRLFVPALGAIRQEASNRWIEYDTPSARVGLICGRHPNNPQVVEFCHLAQSRQTRKVSMLRVGATWLGLKEPSEPDWTAILKGVREGYAPAREADETWAQTLNASLQVAPALGGPLPEEDQLPGMVSLLLFDLTVMAVLSADAVQLKPRWMGPDGTWVPTVDGTGHA